AWPRAETPGPLDYRSWSGPCTPLRGRDDSTHLTVVRSTVLPGSSRTLRGLGKPPFPNPVSAGHRIVIAGENHLLTGREIRARNALHMRQADPRRTRPHPPNSPRDIGPAAPIPRLGGHVPASNPAEPGLPTTQKRAIEEINMIQPHTCLS